MALPLHNPPLCLPGFLAIFLQLILSLFFCLPLLSPALFFSFFLSLSVFVSLLPTVILSFESLPHSLPFSLNSFSVSFWLFHSHVTSISQALFVSCPVLSMTLSLFLFLTFQLSFSSLSLCSLILPFLLLPFSIHVSLIALTLSFLLHL